LPERCDAAALQPGSGETSQAAGHRPEPRHDGTAGHHQRRADEHQQLVLHHVRGEGRCRRAVERRRNGRNRCSPANPERGSLRTADARTASRQAA
jgi:hypothetical protein